MRSSWRSLGTSCCAAAGLLLAGAVLRASQAPVRHLRSDRRSDQVFRNPDPAAARGQLPACHGESAMAGLRVDSREGMLRGGETGPAIVPGDPDKSTLIKAVQHADGFPRMPRGRAKLGAQDVDALAQWIRDGAVWPAAGTPRRHRLSLPSARSPRNNAPTGRSVRSPSRAHLKCAAPTGRAPTSIVSSSRVSSGRDWLRSGPRTSSRCSAARRSISPACRHHLTKSTRS